MTNTTSFRIVVEQDDRRLVVSLTPDGSLAFHITNQEGSLDAVIEADAYLFEQGLTALIDTMSHQHQGCCEEGHHHEHSCCVEQEENCGCHAEDCEDEQA